MVSMGVRACPGKGGKGRKETDFAGLSPFGQVCVREKKKNDGVSIRVARSRGCVKQTLEQLKLRMIGEAVSALSIALSTTMTKAATFGDS